MRRGQLFRLVSVLTLLAFSLSCLTTQIPPISASGSGFKPEPDEKRMWGQAREEEQKLLSKAKIYNDPLLVDYLDGLVQRLNPKGMADNPDIGFKVTVLEDPTLNAFAFPHGALYVHTGLLSRMENEDQLATVLAHEMTHVENRHAIRYQRSQQNKMIAFSIASIAAAVLVAGAEGRAEEQGRYVKARQIGVLSEILVGLGLQLAFLAAVNGYGRDLEREADQGGFEKMTRSHFDTLEAPRVYQLLMDNYGDSSKTEVFFFGSHPRLTERIQNAKEWNTIHPPAVSSPAPGQESIEAFNRRLRPVVRDDARLNIDGGRLEVAEVQLKRVLKATPNDPQAQLLWGRLRLKQADAAKDQAKKADLEKDAAVALREALRLRPEIPDAHRDLGILAFKAGQKAEACSEFQKYLSMAPQASDSDRIRDYVVELQHSGACR